MCPLASPENATFQKRSEINYKGAARSSKRSGILAVQFVSYCLGRVLQTSKKEMEKAAMNELQRHVEIW